MSNANLETCQAETNDHEKLTISKHKNTKIFFLQMFKWNLVRNISYFFI